MPEASDAELVEAPDITATSAGLETVRLESREVITEQLMMLRETDQKAVATTRMIALILGLFLSAASLADDPLAFTNAWVTLGGAVLFVAFVIGTSAFSVDRPAQGLGPGYFDDELPVLEEEDEILPDLLVRYSDWIEENTTHLENNANYLLAAQAFLIGGLLLITLGVSSELGQFEMSRIGL